MGRGTPEPHIPPALIACTYHDPDEDLHAGTPGALEASLFRE